MKNKIGEWLNKYKWQLAVIMGFNAVIYFLIMVVIPLPIWILRIMGILIILSQCNILYHKNKKDE